MKFDIGTIDDTWAISLDIGRLSIIAGDLVGRYGLRLVWYSDVWAYALEVSTNRISISDREEI
jgi:hypothetical protein